MVSWRLLTRLLERRPEHRARARKYVEENKPKLLIGSPMCTMFSTLRNLSKWNEEKQRKWVEARVHIQFVCELYEEQIKGGRWFLHEHPAGASSWHLEEIKKIEQKHGVGISVADQCVYGL